MSLATNKKIKMAVILILFCISLSACSIKSKQNIQPFELLIGKEVIPEGWEEVEYSEETAENEGQEIGSYIIFQQTDSEFFVRIGESIYKYSSIRKAKWHYNRFLKNFFNKNYYDLTEWVKPYDFNFESAYTDNWQFACAIKQEIFQLDESKTSEICQFIAQYDEFLVYSSIKKASDDVEHLSYIEILNLIIEMDRNITEKLSE